MAFIDSSLLFLTLLAISTAGAILHYVKKQYVDHTIKMNLLNYIKSESGSTINAFFSLVAGSFGMATAHATAGFTLQEIGMAFMLGYGLDSWFNRVEPSEDLKPK